MVTGYLGYLTAAPFSAPLDERQAGKDFLVSDKI
jgi:hypothetical protein